MSRIESLFHKIAIGRYTEIGTKIKVHVDQAKPGVDSDLALLVTAHIVTRLFVHGIGTTHLIQVSEQDYGVSRYRMWKASRDVLREIGWKLVERCKNTCTDCHTVWESIVVTRERDKFIPICPKCGHRSIDVHNVAAVPKWEQRKAISVCTSCKGTLEHYIVETDPFRANVVQAICPKCLVTLHHGSAPPNIRRGLEDALKNGMNSVLYELQSFFDLPVRIVEMVRYLTEGIEMLPSPLFKVFAAIEIAKTLLYYKGATNYRKYMRKTIEIVRFKKTWWIEWLLQTRNIKIVEDKIATCPRCKHVSIFMKDGSGVRCPSCFAVIEFNAKFTSFVEGDPLV